MRRLLRVAPLCAPVLLWACPLMAATRLDDEGTSQGYINAIDCVGSGISCARSGITGTLTVTGGGGNPAGSGSELQFRSTGTTFGAVTSSSVSGANVTLAGDLALSGFAGPDITWVPTGGDTWHAGAENGPNGGMWFLSNSTDAKHIIEVDGLDALYFPQLTSCATLGTGSIGKVYCNTATAGSGTVTSITQGTGMSFSVSPITTTGTINLATPVTAANGGTGANNTATLNRYLKGDGTNFTTSAGSASGTGSCTNQVVTATNSDAVPTCAAVSNAMLTNSSITVAGTTNQVSVVGSPVSLGGTVTLSTPQDIGTASTPTFLDLRLAGTGPDIRWTPTSGDAFHLGAEFATGSGSMAFFSNVTDGIIYWMVDNQHFFYLPRTANCTALATTADGKVICANLLKTSCKTLENLVAADDNMYLDTMIRAITVQHVSCRTSGFTTQPTIVLEDGSGNAIVANSTNQGPTCNGTETQNWTNVVSGGAVTANEAIRFDTTNTPDPTFGTQTNVCFTYTEN